MYDSLKKKCVTHASFDPKQPVELVTPRRVQNLSTLQLTTRDGE